MSNSVPPGHTPLSADSVRDNIARLQALFPDAVRGGRVDLPAFHRLLGVIADRPDEPYGLSWPGKARARELALAPTTATWLPCPEDSRGPDASGNLFLEGDNLDALKLLRRSHAGRVRLILIDPPYNTGRPSLYPDDFRAPAGDDHPGARAHAAWLSMMFPRLLLARDLLRDDGLLLLHIDEHEYAHAALLLAEVFGEEHLLGAAVWDKKNPKGDATGLSCQHESILFAARDRRALAATGGLVRPKRGALAMLARARQLFARLGTTDLPADLKDVARRYGLPADCLRPFLRPIDLDAINREFADWVRRQHLNGGEAAYCRIDEHGDVYRLVSMAWPNKQPAPPTYFLPLRHPLTGRDCPVPKRGWRNPPATMRRLLDAGLIVFGPDHTTQPQRKYLLRDTLTENLPSVIGHGGSDDKLLARLGIPFDNPKPVELARQLIAAVVRDDAIVLDFFAGSGTTAHALMLHNAATGSAATYILVQSPEPLDPRRAHHKPAAAFCDRLGKPRTLAELTKERLRRAAAEVQRDHPACAADLGFRVLKLAPGNTAPTRRRRRPAASLHAPDTGTRVSRHGHVTP